MGCRPESWNSDNQLHMPQSLVWLTPWATHTSPVKRKLQHIWAYYSQSVKVVTHTVLQIFTHNLRTSLNLVTRETGVSANSEYKLRHTSSINQHMKLPHQVLAHPSLNCTLCVSWRRSLNPVGCIRNNACRPIDGQTSPSDNRHLV